MLLVIFIIRQRDKNHLTFYILQDNGITAHRLKEIKNKVASSHHNSKCTDTQLVAFLTGLRLKSAGHVQ